MPAKRKRPVDRSEQIEMDLQGLQKIIVMISSRNRDRITYHGEQKELTDVRSDCGTEINATELYGARPFEAWINEEGVESAERSTETCLKRISEADLVIVFYNGRAGWAVEQGGIGICHAELARAISESPAKVFIVKLPLVASDEDSFERDQRFRNFVDTTNAWYRQADTGEMAVFRAKEALVQGLTRMVHKGVREARRGAGVLGEALSWEKLTFEERAEKIARSATQYLASLKNAEASSADGVVLRLGDVPVLCLIHAVPEALSNATARERVGQVFQSDHLQLPAGKSPTVGPIHLILVHRNATRTQARNMLGVDDSTCFETPFGVFVSDEFQKTQLVIISNCVDDTATRVGLQKWIDWMKETAEETTLSDRATRRSMIVRAIQEANH